MATLYYGMALVPLRPLNFRKTLLTSQLVFIHAVMAMCSRRHSYYVTTFFMRYCSPFRACQGPARFPNQFRMALQWWWTTTLYYFAYVRYPAYLYPSMIQARSMSDSKAYRVYIVVYVACLQWSFVFDGHYTPTLLAPSSSHPFLACSPKRSHHPKTDFIHCRFSSSSAAHRVGRFAS